MKASIFVWILGRASDPVDMAGKMVLTAFAVAAWRWPPCSPNDYPCAWNAFPITRSKRTMVASVSA
jgi:predicted RNA polymerase sigma factor